MHHNPGTAWSGPVHVLCEHLPPTDESSKPKSLRHVEKNPFNVARNVLANYRCGQSSPIIVSPGREAEGSQSGPFSIQIVPASTMRYHAYLQWVRMASRNFSRTAVISENPTESYRDLAKAFHLSIGTLSRIARRFEGKRKAGRRPRRLPPANNSILPAPDEKNPSDLP